MKSYEDVKAEVDQMTDGLGKRVDPKIKKAVIALRMMGVETDGSCEGHRDWGLPYPWVSVYTPKQEESAWAKANLAERNKVEPLVDEFNKAYTPKYPLILENQGIFSAFRIQSFYRDQDVDVNSLEEYQEIMEAFADFVLKYQASV